MKEETVETLRMLLLNPLETLWREIMLVIPNVLGAIAILIAGYFIARLVSFVVEKLIVKLSIDSLARKSGISSMLEKIDSSLSLSKVLSKLVYFIILITFIMSAAEALKMEIMAEALKSIIMYLPNVIASIFVFMFGFFLANSAKVLISKSAHDVNIEFADVLGKVVYFIIVIITMSLAISQLDIQTQLLNQVASIVLIAIGVALALSLGLGTKELSSLIISGNYIRDIYSAGDVIIINDIKGTVVMVGTTKTIIKTEDNKEVSISNELLLKSTVIKEN